MSSDGILTISASKMAEEPEEHKVIRSVEEVQKSSQVQRSLFPADETISLHEECEKESKATHDCMDSVAEDTSIEDSLESETAREVLLTDSAATSSHDTDFDFVESENQSKETIDNKESIVPAKGLADSSTFVSDEMQSCSEFADISDASLCRRSSIAMTETSGNLSASRDFGTSSQDSLLFVILEDENDSETAEVLHLEDSQQAIDIQDLKNSQESSDIVEVKGSEAIEILDLTESQEDIDILDVKDSQGSVDILEVKGSSVEILDLQDSQESVDILDGEDSHETVAEAQNVSGQNSKSSTIFDVTDDAVSVQERSNTIDEELAQFSWQNKYENDSAVQENFNYQTIPEETLDSKRTQSAAIESCTNSFQLSRDCTHEEEAVDSVGQLNLEETTETKESSPTDTNTSSKTIAEESAEAIESLKGTRRIQRDSPEELLLITKRGNFFQDSFFLDAHRDFSAALRQVLGRCNQVNFEDDTDLRHTDILERYRQLRSRDLREENQAAIVTSDKSCMKIIMDVHDFMSGDVQAKVVDEKELVIEGLVVKKEEGTSSETSHSFRRRFSLPQFTKITSVMSLDGILTVTVMFKEGNVEANTAENSIKTEAKRIKRNHSLEITSLPAEKRLLETKNENQNGLNEYMTSQSEETRHFLEISRREKTPYLDCSFEDSNRLRRFGQESGRESQETNKYNVTEDAIMGTSSRLASGSLSSFTEKSFPITRKGHFFSHYFFRDTREDFQKAVREILSRWGEKSCGDEMTSYRKLRARNMREDTQAVTSSEDERHYKFVIDVHDFMDVGEISVKAVNERELVVEGHLEKKEDGSKSSKRFLRRFVVPGDIELEAVISVMSSDGVLKILAPKKEGHNRKHFSIDVEDMDDVEATVSRKFRNGHRLAEEYLKKRDSSSDDEELRAFAKQSNNHTESLSKTMTKSLKVDTCSTRRQR
nr:uncharacterized protein LOC113825289 [Penaeus vannamei]